MGVKDGIVETLMKQLAEAQVYQPDYVTWDPLCDRLFLTLSTQLFSYSCSPYANQQQLSYLHFL